MDTTPTNTIPVIATDEPVKTVRAPLWKQLAGAVAGALIALAVYGAYKWTVTLAGSVATPAAEVEVTQEEATTDDERVARFAKIGEHAQEILEAQ